MTQPTNPDSVATHDLENGKKCCKLCPCSLGIAIGLTCGLGMLIMGWIAGFADWGRPMVKLIASAYYGYAEGFVGGIIGGIWGFIDGFIGGFLIGWFYNLCFKCKGKCKWMCPASKKD